LFPIKPWIELFHYLLFPVFIPIAQNFVETSEPDKNGEKVISRSKLLRR